MYALVALLGADRAARRSGAAFTDRRASARPAAVGDRLRRRAGGDALHAQLGAVLRRGAAGSRGCRCCVARAPASAPRPAPRPAWSASAARSCCTCRGCRPRSTRRPHRRAVGGVADRAGAARLARACSASYAQVALLLVGGAGLAMLSRRHAAGSRAAGRAAGVPARVGVLTIVLAWLASQVSPAWANRYLAVAVPPLLLAAAAGLAHAGRLGIAGADRGGRVWAATARRTRRATCATSPRRSRRASRPATSSSPRSPSRSPCSTTTCPTGVRFATLTGPSRDVGVTDWRDGTERLEATSARATCKPLLDALKPGQRLALVVPIIFDVRRWRAPWTSLGAAAVGASGAGCTSSNDAGFSVRRSSTRSSRWSGVRIAVQATVCQDA